MKNTIFVCGLIFFHIVIWIDIALAQDALFASTPTSGNTTQESSASATVPQEETNAEEIINNEKDEKHLENSVVNNNLLEPSSVEVVGSFSEQTINSENSNLNSDSKNEEAEKVYNGQVFIEATSQNSGVGNDILNSGGPPVVITLSDAATTELKQRAASIPSQTNENNNEASSIKSDVSSQSQFPNNSSKRSDQAAKQQTDDDVPEIVQLKENLTEEIPSFSEWAQKQLMEEEEKKKDPQNTTSQNVNQQNQHSGGQHGREHPANGSGRSQAKLRWKNYASLDCGAKVVASNPEAVSPSAILSPSRDEYKLNTCTSRIWFIVELCEAIQAKKIDLANFELFSSSPKDFTVSVSDRFPTREWSNVGQFTAKDEKDVQNFDLYPHLFGKYIKVEVKSHYGAEHYCPISLFKVYGTSEFEVLQKEDSAHANRADEDDDDEEEDDEEALDVDGGDSSKNLFSSATDAVINIVKKAASVLGKKGNNTNNQTISTHGGNGNYTPLVKICTSPRHLVVCDNCSDTLFGQIYGLLSCNRRQIENLVDIVIIRKALSSSSICNRFGLTFKSLNNGQNDDEQMNNNNSEMVKGVKSFFSEQFLGAMCNTLAIMENKIVLNTSKVYLNSTENIISTKNGADLVNIETREQHVLKPDEENVKQDVNEKKIDDDNNNNEKIAIPTSVKSEETDKVTTCTTDSTIISLTSQIKPTKTLANDEIESNTEATPLMPSETETVHEFETATVNNVTDIRQDDDDEVVYSGAGGGVVVGGGNGVESTENLDEHLDNLIGDLNGAAGENNNNNNNNGQATVNTATSSSSTTTTTTATNQSPQKESVFLRLSNRIKALERNMSLSGQYLEELSKRYKKQVEEIQKLLDKTILAMSEESQKKDERNRQLEERLMALTTAVDALRAERSSWSFTIYCVIVSTLVTLFIIRFCYSNNNDSSNKGNLSTSLSSDQQEQRKNELKRRKSIDVVQHNHPQKKKRRPSDQALKIVRSSMESSNEIVYNINKEKKMKRKKKLSSGMLKRSNSINTLSEESSEYRSFKPNDNSSRLSSTLLIRGNQQSDWIEDKKHLEEVPIVLEDSEHSSLEPLTLPETNKILPPPNYVQTAVNVRAVRINGNVALNDEDDKKWVSSSGVDEIDENDDSSSTSRKPSNGNFNGENQTPKKEKKSLKKMLKKVF